MINGNPCKEIPLQYTDIGFRQAFQDIIWLIKSNENFDSSVEHRRAQKFCHGTAWGYELVNTCPSGRLETDTGKCSITIPKECKTHSLEMVKHLLEEEFKIAIPDLKFYFFEYKND